MPRLTPLCPVCRKNWTPTWETLDSFYLHCKHRVPKTQTNSIPTEVELEFTSVSQTKNAYDFQKDGVRFLLNNNLSGLIGDDMGLGKTIQALVAIREYKLIHKKKDGEFPVLILVKSSITYNWYRELCEWLEPDRSRAESKLHTMIIQGRDAFIPKGFNYYILSHDSLAGNVKALQKLAIQCVVVDECHSFKDPSSQRTLGLMKLVAGVDLKGQKDYTGYRTIKTEEKDMIPHRIFLSGTPVINRADEFFTTLNLLDPLTFPSFGRFRSNWLVKIGRYHTIHPHRRKYFQEKTSKYYLRRIKTDVMKSLPPFSRNYEFVTILDPEVKNTYNANLKSFRVEMEQGDLNSIQILGWLTKMRRLTALAKLPAANEWIEEFQENAALDKSFDPSYDKLLIGVHHEDVVNNLHLAYREKFGSLALTGKHSAYEKDQIVRSFTSDPNKKMLVCSMLAGGVGLNIQASPNIVVIERQWSAAMEEQFEARAWRDGQKYPVVATYLVAAGTIDQFFHEIVEEKRKICKTTLEVDEQTITSLEGMRQLAWKVIDNPL